MKSRSNTKEIEHNVALQSRPISNGMNKILKTTLIALAGITFFGVNFVMAPFAHAADKVVITSATVAPATSSTPNDNTDTTTINNGDSVTLRWASNAPSQCLISGGNIDPNTPLSRPPSGEQTVPVTIDSTWANPVVFGIKCINPDTFSISPSTYLYVNVNMPTSATQPVVSLTATPQQLAADNSTQQINISWTASNTKAPNGCLASGPGNWAGPKEYSGTWTIKPPQAGTYSLTCTSPTGETGTGNVSVTTAAPPAGQNPNLGKLQCWKGITDGFDVPACLTIGAYYAFYVPSSWLLMGAVYFFDMALSLSISSAFVNKPFVSTLWVLLRNFSNMIFIFILLYTGIQTMLGLGNWKKTVINVIVIALLINFSLFFTKVVIDAGNVLAVGVYNSMGTTNTSGIKTSTSDVQQRGIASGIAAQFQPQKFLGEAGAKALTSPLDALIIFLVAAFVSLTVAYIFFKGTLLFLGRLVAFWFLMILSPFAFISIALPKGSIFNWWSNTLLDQAFVAPVFLFLIYLVMQGVSAGGGILSGVVGDASSTSTFIFDKLVVPITIAIIIFLALQKALKVAEKMSGDFGKMASEYASKAIGAGVAVASGGASLAAGQAGSMLAASGKLQEGALSSNKITRGVSKLGLLAADKAQNATFDVRNIGGGAVGKTLGLGKGSEMTYTSQGKKWNEDREKKNEHMAKLMERPQKAIEQKEHEANLANRADYDAEQNLKKAEEKAAGSETGKAVVAAQKAEKELVEKETAAAAALAIASENLKKITSNPNALEDPNYPGKKIGQADAERAEAVAKKTASDATMARTTAKNNVDSAISTHSASAEGIDLAAAAKRRAETAEIKKIKDANLKKAKNELIEENAARREVYARHKDSGDNWTASGRTTALNRANKIRNASAKAKKAKEEKEEESMTKAIQKIAAKREADEAEVAKKAAEAAKKQATP